MWVSQRQFTVFNTVWVFVYVWLYNHSWYMSIIHIRVSHWGSGFWSISIRTGLVEDPVYPLLFLVCDVRIRFLENPVWYVQRPESAWLHIHLQMCVLHLWSRWCIYSWLPVSRSAESELRSQRRKQLTSHDRSESERLSPVWDSVRMCESSQLRCKTSIKTRLILGSLASD